MIAPRPNPVKHFLKNIFAAPNSAYFHGKCALWRKRDRLKWSALCPGLPGTLPPAFSTALGAATASKALREKRIAPFREICYNIQL
jgi:hypothetical protein